MHNSITIDRVIEAVKADRYIGLCVECGAETYNTEPDARHYHCDSCGFMEVYGAEELLLMLAF